MTTYSQFAQGDFTIKVVAGTKHCGIGSPVQNLHYEVELQFDNCDRQNCLDEQGFLLDNTAFRGYFTALSTQEIDISCELLAQKIASDIVAMANRPSLRTVRVTLSPFAGVGVTYTLVVPATPVNIPNVPDSNKMGTFGYF